MKNKVGYFEIPASDLMKAQEFYSKVFDWKFNKIDEDYIRVMTCDSDETGMMSKEVGAINGGLQKRGERAKAPTFVIATDNIDEQLEKIKEAGGTIAVPKDDMGGMGFYAQFEDPEGNRLGLFQMK